MPENRVVTWDNPVFDLKRAISLASTDSPKIANHLDREDWLDFPEFLDFVITIFDKPIDIQSVYVGYLTETYINKQNPEWAYGFPHSHGPHLTALAMVIQVPESGGYAMLKGELYKPVVGQGVLIQGAERHGVKRIYGPTPRITLITQFKERK